MSSEQDDKNKQKEANAYKEIFHALGLIAHLGITMLVNIGLGFFFGYFMDNLLGREIVFKIIGIIIGVLAGFYSIYKLLSRFFKD
ncbi:AtpZ/AtpI family protein [Natronospora cellulosivora (SeqCode)]